MAVFTAGGAEQSCRSLIGSRAAMAENPYPAEKARGGEIILRTPLRRAIFLAGLSAAVVPVLVLVMMR